MEKDYFKGGKRTWKVYGRATTPSKGQGEEAILSSGPTCHPGVIGLMMMMILYKASKINLLVLGFYK